MAPPRALSAPAHHCDRVADCSAHSYRRLRLGSVCVLVTLIFAGLMSGPADASSTECIDHGQRLRLVGSYQDGTAYGSLVESEGFLYVARPPVGLDVLDVSAGANPRKIGELEYPSVFGTLQLLRPGVLVGISSFEVLLIDVSDPTNPFVSGSFRDEGVELSDGLAVSGEHVFIPFMSRVRESHGVLVVDTSDLSRPAVVDTVDTGAYTGYIARSEDRIVVGGAGLTMLDIRDPLRVTTVGHWDPQFWIRDLVADSKRLFVSYFHDPADPDLEWEYGVQVFSLCAGGTLTPRGRISFPFVAPRLVLDGNRLFARDERGVTVMDVSDDDFPRVIHRRETYDAGGSAEALPDVCVADESIFVSEYWNVEVWRRTGSDEGVRFDTASLRLNSQTIASVDGYLLSVNAPRVRLHEHLGQGKLSLLSEINLGAVHSGSLRTSGRLAYLVRWPDQDWANPELQVLDLTDPPTIEIRGSTPLAGPYVGGPHSIVVEGRRGVVLTEAGAQTLDLSDPVHPRASALVDYPGTVEAIHGSDRWLALVGTGGTRIYDATRTEGPTFEFALPDIQYGRLFDVAGDFAYLRHYSELVTYDLATREITDRLPLLHEMDASTWVRDGRHAYVASRWLIDVYDLQDPARPRLVGGPTSLHERGWAETIVPIGNDLWFRVNDEDFPEWLVLPAQCDQLSVPVTLRGLDVRVTDDSVTLEWSLSESSTEQELRVRARRGSGEWTVPAEHLSWGTWRAVDGSPSARLGGAVLYRIERRTMDSTWEVLAEKTVDRSTPRFRAELVSATPNPFNPTTTLVFALPPDQPATLRVYDLRGRRISTLLDGPTPGGRQTLSWSPRDLASGVYMLWLECDGEVDTRRVALLR